MCVFMWGGERFRLPRTFLQRYSTSSWWCFFSHCLHLQLLAVWLFNLVILGFYPINCASLMQTPFVYLCVAVCANTCVRVWGRVTLLISGPPVGVHRPIYLRLIPLSPQRLRLKGAPEEKNKHCKAKLFQPQSLLYINARTHQHICCCT